MTMASGAKSKSAWRSAWTSSRAALIANLG
jgi:hypothetical protein